MEFRPRIEVATDELGKQQWDVLTSGLVLYDKSIANLSPSYRVCSEHPTYLGISYKSSRTDDFPRIAGLKTFTLDCQLQ
jgi:hypothetical protein